MNCGDCPRLVLALVMGLVLVGCGSRSQPNVDDGAAPPRLNWREQDAALLPELAESPAGTFTVSATWATVPHYAPGFQEPLPPPLVVELQYECGPERRVVAVGNVQINVAQTAAGRLRRIHGLRDDLTGRDLGVLNHRDRFARHPVDGFRIPLTFAHPPGNISQIEEISGQVDVLMSGNQQELGPLSLEDLKAQAETDPRLREIDFQVREVDELSGGTKGVEFSTNTQGLLSQLFVTTKDGTESFISRRTAINVRGRNWYDFTSSDATESAVELQYRFTIHASLTRERLDFRRADLHVPSAPRPPDPEQLRHLSWIPSAASRPVPELPNLRLAAQVRPGNATAAGALTPPLDLMIELTGPEIDDIVAVGDVQIQQARTAQADVERRDYHFEREIDRLVIGVDQLDVEEPCSLITRVLFEPLFTAAESFEVVRGELTVITVRSRRVIQFENPFAVPTPRLIHPELTALNITLKQVPFADQSVLIAVNAGPEHLGRVHVLSRTGLLLREYTAIRTNLPGATEYLIGLPPSASRDVVLEVELMESPQQVRVPFEFRDLPVPQLPR